MEQVQELTVVEQASKRTAKAALRYQKQTENINKKIHAVGVITKSVEDRLTRISNVDDREFETLTSVIDGQVDLSKRAVDLDKQWKTMVEHQRAELSQLRDMNTTLKDAYQNRVSAITSLHDLADENHKKYIEDLTVAETQLKNINDQISAFNTNEYMSQVTILVSALSTQLAKEKQAHMEQAEKINTRMTALRKATKALLVASGHYTKVMQTIDAKVNYIAKRVDLLDEKVASVSPVFDDITESDIVELFSTLSEATEPEEDETIDAVDESVTDTESNDAHDEQPDTQEEDRVSPDSDDDDTPNEPDVTSRRAKHGAEKETKSSKWKFWAK